MNHNHTSFCHEPYNAGAHIERDISTSHESQLHADSIIKYTNFAQKAIREV